MNTENYIVKMNYTRHPMPDSIIKKVEKLVDSNRDENGISYNKQTKNFSIGQIRSTTMIKSNQNKMHCQTQIWLQSFHG